MSCPHDMVGYGTPANLSEPRVIAPRELSYANMFHRKNGLLTCKITEG